MQGVLDPLMSSLIMAVPTNSQLELLCRDHQAFGVIQLGHH
jgi:hypothetical protein